MRSSFVYRCRSEPGAPWDRPQPRSQPRHRFRRGRRSARKFDARGGVFTRTSVALPSTSLDRFALGSDPGAFTLRTPVEHRATSDACSIAHSSARTIGRVSEKPCENLRSSPPPSAPKWLTRRGACALDRDLATSRSPTPNATAEDVESKGGLRPTIDLTSERLQPAQ